MNYNRLTRTGLEVSQITFGCWELGGGQWEKQEDAVNIQAIQTAFDLGITTFDTAEGYGKGHSEEIVGLALEGKRKECVIATKVSPDHLRSTEIRHSIERSLKRLRSDYVDIYYVHWPNNEIPMMETISELQRLKDEKVIRAIGVSNFSMGQLEEAMSISDIDVIQPEYSLLNRTIEKELKPYCIDKGIGIMSYSSVAKGILTGAYHLGGQSIRESDFRKERRLFLPEHLEKEAELIRVLQSIADTHEVTLSDIAISWILHQDGLTSAIVGTQNIHHLKENAKAVLISLTPDELDLLDNTSKKVLSRIDDNR